MTDKKNLRPLIENYKPEPKKYRVIKYDVIPNKSTVGFGPSGHSIVLRVPYRKYMDTVTSMWASRANYQHFLHEFLPGMKSATAGKQQQLMSMFKEVKYPKGNCIKKEGDKRNDHFYLIGEG